MKKDSTIKEKIATIFMYLSVIGSFYIGLKGLSLEWSYIKKSLWYIFNPFIHFEAVWDLLHDSDTYAVLALWGITFLLFKSIKTESNNTKTKSKKFEWNPETTGHTVSDKKIYIFLIACGIIFLSSIIYAERYEYANKNTIDVSDQWEQITPEAIENMIVRGNLNVKGRDKDGKTPLIYAALYNKNPNVIDILIKYGADIEARDNFGNTPLMWATISSNNHYEVIETLIKHRASINTQNMFDQTALMFAAEHTTNPEVIKVLIKHGANIHARDYFSLVDTVLWSAVGSNPNLSVIETLIKHGANIKEKNKENGVTLLMLAAGFNSNPEIVELLIKHGIDVKAKDVNGKTALDYAKNNSDIYKTQAYWHLNDLMYK